MLEIKNGDIFDIGQTVNGISKFLWFNNKWHYFNETMSYEYQYSQEDLTKLISENEDASVKFICNIFIPNNSALNILFNEISERIKFLNNEFDDFKNIKIMECEPIMFRISQLLISNLNKIIE